MPAHRPARLSRYGLALLATVALSLISVAIAAMLQPDHAGQVSGPLLLLAVLISAWYGGTGPGLVAAALSFVCLELFFIPPLLSFGLRWADVPRAVVFLCTAAAISLVNTRRRRVEHLLHKSESALSAAREIQQRFLPATPPSLPGFDVAGTSCPAEATGGDYFDYIPMRGGRLGLIVADVSGHGFDSALLMAETRAYLRALMLTHDHIEEILALTNAILLQDTDEGRFVTMFLGCLDPSQRCLSYAGAGHEAFLFRRDGGYERLCSTCLPLGVTEDLACSDLPTIRLLPGDVLVLVTDGILEAKSRQGEVFGVPRLHDVVRADAASAAREILDALYAAVRDFADGKAQEDDMTLVVVKVD